MISLRSLIDKESIIFKISELKILNRIQISIILNISELEILNIIQIISKIRTVPGFILKILSKVMGCSGGSFYGLIGFIIVLISLQCIIAIFSFYHYGAEIPIEEISFPTAIPNGHLE